jgi:hypothetical protein
VNPNTQPTQPAAVLPPGAQPPQVIPASTGVTNPNSTQNTLKISEIRDGIVIMSDGSFRAVVMCKSINFDLMSPQEREAVEFSYQGFLNSLYFPVQIFIRSQKVDLTPYLEKLERIRSEQDNMLLGLLMDDYVAFLSDIAKQSSNFFTGMADLLNPKKSPHVVIDESLLENAKTELRNRVQAVMQGLLECGIHSLPLDTQELIELYYDAYNPDTATRQQLKNFDDMTAPVVIKGAGDAPQPGLDKEAA